jgi:hypothetical protein
VRQAGIRVVAANDEQDGQASQDVERHTAVHGLNPNDLLSAVCAATDGDT